MKSIRSSPVILCEDRLGKGTTSDFQQFITCVFDRQHCNYKVLKKRFEKA